MLRTTANTSAPRISRAVKFFTIFAALMFGTFTIPAAASKSSWLFEQTDSLEKLLAPQASRPDILWMQGSVASFVYVNNTVKYTPDGQYIAVLNNSHLKIIRVSDGILIRTIFFNAGISAWDMSTDGQFIAVASGSIKVYRLSNGEIEKTLPMQYTPVNVAFSPDGSKILTSEQQSGYARHIINLWNFADGSFIRNFNQTPNTEFYAYGNPFTLDGSKVAIGYNTCCTNGFIALVNISNGSATQITPNNGADTFGSTYQFSPNGRYLADGYGIIDTQCGAGTCGHLVGVGTPRGSVAFSPNGQTAALGVSYQLNTGVVRLYNTSNWSLIRSYSITNVGSDQVSVAFSPNSQTVVAAADQFLTARDVSDGTGTTTRQIASLTGNSVGTIAFSADGQTIATGSNIDTAHPSGRNSIQLWNAANGSLRSVNFAQSSNYQVRYIALTPDGQTLVTEGSAIPNQTDVRFWNTATGNLIRSVPARDVRLSPDGNYYSNLPNTGGSTEQIEIRRVADDSLVRTIGIYFRRGILSFTLDSQQIVAFGGQYSTTLQVYNISDGTLVRQFDSFPDGDAITSTALQYGAISPDGTRLAMIYQSGKIRIFNFLTGTVLQTMTNHTSSGQSIAFSPDGQNLISSSWDNTIRLWRVSDGALLQTYDRETGGPGSNGNYFVAQTAFSPNGSRFAFGRTDGALVMARNPFSTTPPTFTINGQITRGGSALSGVSVALSGSAANSTTTDANGNYSFNVNEGGSYTVTPTLAGNNFTPASQTFNFIAQNQTADFTAALVTYTISGNVKADGANLAGATVSLSGGQTSSIQTDANGNYLFTVPAGANYAVSVYKDGIVFNPASQTFTNLQANQTANFQNGTPLCTPAASGLVAWYKMENNGNDSSGNGNTGNTSVTGFGQGFNGQAMYTAGAQYLTVPDSVSLKPANISLNGWFKMTNVPTAGNFYNLASKYGGDFNGWVLRYRSDQTASFEVFRPSVGGAAVSSVTIPVNTWVNIAATYDGTTVKIFINGVQSGSGSFAGGYSPSTIAMQLGKASWTNGEYSSAQIDEAQIFNRALSASEIAAIYNAESAGVCASSVPTASSTASNGKIAFTSQRTGNEEIFTMNADGTNQINISNNPASDAQAAWSPDGSKIAFRSDRNGTPSIYTMNADGSNQTRITNSGYTDEFPSWSPDGTKIVFNSQRTGQGDIYIMNADGTNQIQLTNYFANDTEPKFSPDGSRIVFSRVTYETGFGRFDIFLMNANGTNETRLTDSPSFVANQQPAFSPDGAKIVFHSSLSNPNADVFVMNANGTNRVNLTQSQNGNQSDGNSPAWSPDGTKITFTSIRDNNREIYTMNADGSNQTRLTNVSALDAGSTWQPIRQSVPVAPTNNVNLNFSNVSQSGNTTAIPLAAAQIPALPSGYSLPVNAPIYDLRTSATFSGSIVVTLDVPNVATAQACANLRILHFTSGAWTSSGNGTPNYNSTTQVCTLTQTVTSLSPFAVVNALAPTAAGVTVGGRVLNVSGDGIKGAIVTLTDQNGNLRTATANKFGAYRFVDVASGATYVITVQARRYQFSNSAQVLAVNEDTNGVDFTADDGGQILESSRNSDEPEK